MITWGPLLLIAVILVSGWVDDWRARRSLRAWASANGYRIVTSRRTERGIRYAAPWLDPSVVTWQVMLRDGQGTWRTGRVRFRFVSIGRDPVPLDVAWDDSD